MYKRILLAYDGSEAGQKALLDCRDIAHWSQAEISLVAVMSLSVGVMGIEGGYYSSERVDQEKRRYQGTLNDGGRRLCEGPWPSWPTRSCPPPLPVRATRFPSASPPWPECPARLPPRSGWEG